MVSSHMPLIFPAKPAGAFGGGVDRSVPQISQKDVVLEGR